MADTVFIENIATILLNAREQIRANMRDKGINASGRTSAALQVVQRGNQIMLIKEAGQNAPFQTLQYGRRGGKVPAGFADILYQWSVDKGLSFSTDRERNTFAYFLARKIARQGTDRNRNPRQDIYTQPIEQAVEGIKNETKKYVIQGIKGAISGGFV